MRDNPLVSIITVCLNSQEYISDTIESVLSQSYENIEYIIVDAESTDSTLDIVKRYEPQFNGKIKWISEKDKGIYDAMNKGIKMASGEVIGILNSDDWYDEKALEVVMKNYEKSVDIYYGDLYKVRELRSKYYKKFKRGNKLSEIKKRMSINHPACFVNKNWYRKYSLFDENYKFSADYKFVLQSYLQGAKFKYVNYPFTYMRIGGATSNAINCIVEGFQVKKEVIGKYCISSFMKKIIWYYFLKLRKLIAGLILSQPIFERLKVRGWELMNRDK